MDTSSATQDIYREFIRNLFKVLATNRKQEKSSFQPEKQQHASIQTQMLEMTSRTAPRNDYNWVEHPLSKGCDFKLFRATFHCDNEKKKVS